MPAVHLRDLLAEADAEVGMNVILDNVHAQGDTHAYHGEQAAQQADGCILSTVIMPFYS